MKKFLKAILVLALLITSNAFFGCASTAEVPSEERSATLIKFFGQYEGVLELKTLDGRVILGEPRGAKLRLGEKIIGRPGFDLEISEHCKIQSTDLEKVEVLEPEPKLAVDLYFSASTPPCLERSDDSPLLLQARSVGHTLQVDIYITKEFTSLRSRSFRKRPLNYIGHFTRNAND